MIGRCFLGQWHEIAVSETLLFYSDVSLEPGFRYCYCDNKGITIFDDIMLNNPALDVTSKI